MPVPYPEAFRRGASMSAAEAARKKGVNAIVIALNFLHLDRPSRASMPLVAGKPLSALQWAAVRRFEHFLQAWIDVSPVDANSMGRTAAKVESLEDALHSLEHSAQEFANLHRGYYSGAPKGRNLDLSPSSNKFQGSIGLDKMSTFKPVDPSRLQFVGLPSFDPTPYLDSQTSAVFNDPINNRLPPSDFHGKVPHVRVHCSRRQRVKLFELLDSTRRFAVHTPSEVSTKFGSGLFCVVKDLNRDRLILDSRGANCLEIPILRWVRSLGSADVLLKYVLEPGWDLKVSGNDLKDFYYFFRATESRSRRNVLVGEVNPKEIAHLHCVKNHHLESPILYGSLNTLAMGDTQAVEIAQTCHVGLGLQSGVITKENFLSLHMPLPRGETATGVVIDDFIALSRVRSDVPGAGSTGAAIAEKMQQKYLDVKLMPNIGKGFRDETQSTFWGADLEGKKGTLRASLKRAIPLAGLVLRLVSLGVGSANLLQIIAGSLISIFLFRRRFLSLLDSLFEACAIAEKLGRSVSLAGRVKSDLLVMVALMPLAAANLRAPVSSRILASDASNWGEAACFAKVPPFVAKELYRHVLRKSVWTKLLQPAAAWTRAAGLLDPSEELPCPAETFKLNPLWQVLAEGLEYKLLFAKARKGNRHINVGELRAFLKAERMEARRAPSHRGIFGLDSQVALGTVLKGRSSSKALNRELVRSLPHMLAFDWYSEGIYFETSTNRADDPTRGTEIRGPSRDLPSWWNELASEEYETFDRWMLEHGLDPYELSGLPPIEELMTKAATHAEHTDVKAKTFLDENAAVKSDKVACSRIVHRSPKVPASHASNATDQFCTAGNVSGVSVPGDVVTRNLTEYEKGLLKNFRPSQVVFGTGCSREWPPERQGFLDLFSGIRGVAKAQTAASGVWTLCFDLDHSPHENLLDANLQKQLEELISLKVFLGVGLAPVCASFSSAITPAVRSSSHPYGIPGLGEQMKRKVAEGNQMALWCFAIVALALELCIGVWLENPASSWMFRLPEWIALCDRFPDWQPWTVDYCRFGTKWRKRTRFYSNTALRGWKTLCTRDHSHLLLRGRSQKHRKSWTAVAQAYPKGVSKAVGLAMALKSKLIFWQGSFDPALCAKCSNLRIGEASHPGPRPDARRGRLEDIGLVEERTAILQQKVWLDFANWCQARISMEAWRSALLFPMLLCCLLKEYGGFLYESGKSLYVFRHLVVYAQQSCLGARMYMHTVWDMISRWEIAEPTEHRAPLPSPIFHAMMSIAMQWNWHHFAAVLGLAFYGICRPGEVIASTRRCLVLPSDMMHDFENVAYLRIEKPKGRRRSKGLVQHASIHHPEFIKFLESIYSTMPNSSRLFFGSPAAFRKRWDKLLSALHISTAIRLTPGGLRGGGAIFAFRNGTDVYSLLWRMRLKHLGTLESYLQELVADTVMADLNVTARQRTKAAASLFPFYLSTVTQRASLL